MLTTLVVAGAIADLTYNSDALHEEMTAGGVNANIRLMSTRKHFLAVDHQLYRKCKLAAH